MRAQHTLVAMGLTVALAGCGAAAQQQAKPQVANASCQGMEDVERRVAELYAPGNVQKVERIYRLTNVNDRRFQVRADQPRHVVSGAKIYVAAGPGMTAPYLERQLSCYAASEGSGVHPNDPLKARGIDDVDVAAVGPNFRIEITGVDREADKGIWQRARAFDAATRVQVRQLASAEARDAAF